MDSRRGMSNSGFPEGHTGYVHLAVRASTDSLMTRRLRKTHSTRRQSSIGLAVQNRFFRVFDNFICSFSVQHFTPSKGRMLCIPWSSIPGIHPVGYMTFQSKNPGDTPAVQYSVPAQEIRIHSSVEVMHSLRISSCGNAEPSAFMSLDIDRQKGP